MPNRIIREGILTSPKMAKLGWAEEVFFRRLISVADDFGRYWADSGLLRAACYPRQINKVSDSDIGKWMRCVAEAALVRVYPAADGESYLEILNFGQQVRAKKSKFPDPISEGAADATQMISGCVANEHLDVSVFVDVIPPSPQGGDPPHRKRVSAMEAERPESVPEEVWRDFTALRRTKRALLTPTALAGIEREASKAGIPLSDALATCCRKGWQGFEADWMSKLNPADKQAWAGAK